MYWLLIAAVPTLILLALMSWLLVLVAEEAYLGDRAVAFLYDRAAGVYDTVKARSARHDSRRVALPLARALSGVPRPLILDVATGTGRLPLLMASQRGFAGRIIGLDLSANMLAEARRKTEGLPDAISLLREDALTLSFGDNTFDAVTCLEGLELFSRPEAALREMARVLRSGGVLLISNRVGPETILLPGRTYREGQIRTILRGLSFTSVQVKRWQQHYDLVWATNTGE
ncbi:MAG: class I SAM-dependent methyltransferase [Anaerolineae bacterium]|nr:class I SAM-dependent methyltransferase [Anaerolineae bacterium]